MAVITLQVDTSQAKSALQGVNNAITQIKVNGATVSIGGQKVTGQLKQIQAGATEAGKKINGVTKEATKKATDGIKATTKQFKQGVGIIKTLANGVVSWWTAIIIAIELATKAGTYFFNNLTESIPKLNQKMDNLNNHVKKNYQNWMEGKKTADQYKTSLGELAEKQSLSNTQQVLAQALIDKLNQKYKGLNITIDDTTKKIIGYNEAVKQMNQQDLEQQQKLLNQQISAKREQVNARLAQTFGTDKVSLDHTDVDKMFTYAENLFGDINEAARRNISLAWNSGDLNDKLKILNDLAERYSNNQGILKTINGAITALEELIKLQNDYSDLVDSTNIRLNTAKEILQQTAEVKNKINELDQDTDKIIQSVADDQQKMYYDSLSTEEDKINYLQKKIDDLKTQQEQINNKVGQIENKDYNVEAIKSESDSIQKKIQQSKNSIKQLREKIVEAKREFEKETGRSFIGRPIKSIQQDLDAVIKKRNNPTLNALYGQSYKNQISDLQKQLKAANAINEANREIAKRQKQIDTLTKQLTQNEDKYKKAVNSGLADQQELAKLKNQQAKIAKEIYDKTKEQDKLRDSIAGKEVDSLIADEEARKKAADAEAELANRRKQINENYFQSGENSLTEQYLKLIGKQREALILEQKINLARALGLKSIKELTGEQVRGIARQVDMQMKLEQLSKMSGINIDRPNIISNELARKGGFASSVVVERNNVNKQILSAAQQQVNLQNAIKNEISKYGVIS